MFSNTPDTLFDSSRSGMSEAERALLVGIDRQRSRFSTEESLDELERLVDTAGAVVVARVVQALDAPNPRTYIGSGKAEEIARTCEDQDIRLVVFDEELSPSQQSNLEKVVGKKVKVIDRTALILDIFALHATSREGRLQVRLAQNRYLYPRLRGMWAHLASNRMGGGVGSRFGEGESQLEVDRRMVRKRIASINRELKELASNRAVQRKERAKSGIFRIALAGYTNAGKSSLLNALCEADVLAYDKLFATLDSTTRKLDLPDGPTVTLTDTVGFIQKLPTSLIEAFKSTLDELREADLILHVCDASSESFEEQQQAVLEVLDEIGAAGTPRLLVLNKSDLLEPEVADALRRRFPQAVLVSAHTGDGLPELLRTMTAASSAGDELLSVTLPHTEGKLLSRAHSQCRIVSERSDFDGTHLSLYVPRDLVPFFEKYVDGNGTPSDGSEDAE